MRDFLWALTSENTMKSIQNPSRRVRFRQLFVVALMLVQPLFLLAQKAIGNPSQLPDEQVIERCDLIQKTFNYPYYYCDCAEDNTVEFHFGLDTVITDTLWFSATVSELKYGLSAYWFSDKGIRLELYALCSSTEPTYTMSVGANTMRDIDVDFINSKLADMGDLAELAETIVKPHLRVYPLKGGQGRVLAFAYDEGPHSTCEDLFPVKNGMTYITNHDEDIYAWLPADMRKNQQMFVQWQQKKNLPCEMDFLRGTCANPELICTRTMSDSTKLFFPDTAIVNKAKAAGDTLFFRFRHKAEDVGRVRFRYNIKWQETVMDTTFCEGKSLELRDTILKETTVYSGDTVWRSLDTVDVYTYNVNVIPATLKHDTLRIYKKDLPMYYKKTYYVDHMGEHDVVIRKKNTCTQHILLQVIDLDGDALDETSNPYAPRKVIENGTLYIINDNKRISVLGVERKE